MAYDPLTYDQVLQRAKAFRTSQFERVKELMTQLAQEGQKPNVLFVSCADSRVVPEMIVRARPGDLYVVRTPANIIPIYSVSESAIGASIEHAVRHLGVTHLVVCGHTECGGIKALDKRLDLLKEPAMARWLEHARPVLQQVESRAATHGTSASPVEPSRHRALVEGNVCLQLEHAQTYACVREALQKKTLALHGWVYDLSTGTVTTLNPATGKFE
jgi:carbonic anhydrase